MCCFAYDITIFFPLVHTLDVVFSLNKEKSLAVFHGGKLNLAPYWHAKKEFDPQ